MFSPNHEIWKFAFEGDELDDWLLLAEDLVNKWSKNDEVIFGDRFEIILACFLLMDDLLPLPAKKAIAQLTLDTINEAEIKKLKLESLKVYPPPRGRKKDKNVFRRSVEVNRLIQNGEQKTTAYELVAKKHHKSPETIRRDYERFMKKRLEYIKGEN